MKTYLKKNTWIHYMLAFGTLDDMLKGRESLVRAAGL